MLYDYEPDWRPPGLVELDRPDVLAWKRPGWPQGASRVAYARWDAADADARIAEVLAFFAETRFSWHVGPSSSPADLEQRLLARGLVLGERPRLMTAPLPLTGAFRTSEARIVEVADREQMRAWLALAHNDEPRELDERIRYLAHPGRRTHYLLAFIRGVAVANSAFRWSSDGRCMYLIGASTLEAHRGHGVYQAFVTYRGRLAHERGCEVVSILANRHTSAPILARRGFRDHGELPWFEPRAAT